MDDNKSNNEEKNSKEDSSVNEKEVNKEENIKVKVGTVGNFLLAIFIVGVIATGTLTYYLIHSAKNDYDETYNKIVANITANPVENEVEDEGPDTVANILDSAIADVTSNVNNQNNTSDKTIRNESLVVLYNGLILDTSKMDEVTLGYIDNNQVDSDKYVITYYSYQNFGFKDSSLGTLSETIGDGLVKINDVGKVAISEDYDAIPRTVKVVNTVPSIVADNNRAISDYDSIKTLIVDLDGNGTDEYILILANKKTGYSKITLFDTNGGKIDDLASIEKSKWKKDSTVDYYLSINNIEIIDVDNDGIMELVVEIPHATGNPTVSLLKYTNGVLTGKTKIECSLIN